jgi:hypothetical protein
MDVGTRSRQGKTRCLREFIQLTDEKARQADRMNPFGTPGSGNDDSSIRRGMNGLFAFSFNPSVARLPCLGKARGFVPPVFTDFTLSRMKGVVDPGKRGGLPPKVATKTGYPLLLHQLTLFFAPEQTKMKK